MRKLVKWLLVIAAGCLLSVLPQALMAETLFVEHFDTDVIASGTWTASDASVQVDVANGWLRIGTNGAVDDYAEKSGSFPLPLVIEWRERTYTGDPGPGPYFSLPKLEFWWGPSSSDSYHIMYTDIDNTGLGGWLLGKWTNILTLRPTAWNQWRTVKAIIRSDGGELFAKQDGDLDFTPIVSETWAIPNVIQRFRFSQNTDDVSDFDYVEVSTVDTWCDGFETYSAGTFPGGGWSYTGNSAITVDNSTVHTGNNSLKVFGVIGSCWAGIAVHPLDAVFPVTVEMAIRNGTENLYGCHPQRATMGVSAGPQWTDRPTLGGFEVFENGDFQAEVGPFTVLVNLPANQWHTVRVEYSHLDNGNLQAKYWINGTNYGAFTTPWESWMAGLQYVHLAAQEGTVWFDDVCVKPGPPPPLPVYVDIKPGSCPNPLNIRNVAETYDGQEQSQTTGLGSAARLTPYESKPQKNVLPVAILGTADFDVSQIDPASVKLAGVPVIRWSLEDVATPMNETGNCTCNALGPDGFVDLALKFYAEDLAKALGTVKVGDYVTVKLTGKLLDGTAIEGSDCVVMVGNPKSTGLAQAPTNLSNYPNPFNPSTNISFSLPVASDYKLTIYNVTGQMVEEFNGHSDAGTVSHAWDGSRTASGVYFYRLTAGDFAETKKMMLLK